jgi:hypothetical protein
MAKDFTPVDPKTFDVDAAAERIKTSVGKASPSQRRSGAQWYQRANRDASRIGAGLDPGKPTGAGYDEPTAQGKREGVQRPGRTRLRGAELDAFHSRSQGARQQDVDRGAGAMAVTSPSYAGMNYERSLSASHAAQNIDSSDMLAINKASATLGVTRAAQGTAKKATNAAKKGLGSPEVASQAVAAHEASKTVSSDAATSARAQPHVHDTMLKHTSSVESIGQAHQILSGEKTPEQVLPMDVKTGAYYQNIRDPNHSMRATVDGRSHDIGAGTTVGWGVNRGLGAKGRYSVLEQAHQKAASDLGIKPHQAQAISWVQNKDETNPGGLGNTAPRRDAL